MGLIVRFTMSKNEKDTNPQKDFHVLEWGVHVCFEISSKKPKERKERGELKNNQNLSNKDIRLIVLGPLGSKL